MSHQQSFADYVSSIVNLDDLEKMAEDMDKDIADSQMLMNEIKSVFDSIPRRKPDITTDSGLRHEDLSNFLEAGVPRLLLPDMSASVVDVNLDEVIATMKSYAEELKKNCTVTPKKTAVVAKKIEDLDLEQYAFSLDQLGKRLANIKLTQKAEVNNRNPELEHKLTQLCEDVNMFTQMVQAKTKVIECNKNWSENHQESNSLQYHEIVTKLLSGINEVTYLLKNRN